MANKKVNLIISLKDGVSSKLRMIGGGLKTLGNSFKAVAKVGVAGFAAITAATIALGKAFAEQEKVNKRLASAFNAVGEDGKKAAKEWGAWATSIQRATTLGDEEIMNLVTLGKVMGITNDKLAEATKGAIGLSKAFGIDMTSSMKMVALATQGEYEMLARYIPALRAATTDAEKHAIVQKAMVNGFKMAEAELDTLSGQWEAFKGVVGDAMQDAGGAAGAGGFTDVIRKLKEATIELTESGAIRNYANSWAEVIRQMVFNIGLFIKGLERLAMTLQNLKRDFSLKDILSPGKALSEAFGKAGQKQNREKEREQDREFLKLLDHIQTSPEKTGVKGSGIDPRLTRGQAEPAITGGGGGAPDLKVEAKVTDDTASKSTAPSAKETDAFAKLMSERRAKLKGGGHMDLSGGASADSAFFKINQGGENSFADFQAKYGDNLPGTVSSNMITRPDGTTTAAFSGLDMASSVNAGVNQLSNEASGNGKGGQDPTEKTNELLKKMYDLHDKRMGGVKG